jgi:tetratricopeptide (TPR) repeat protein
VWAPLALLAGVAAAVGLFAAQQRSRGPRTSQSAPGVTAADAASAASAGDAAAKAHAAAGVVPGATPAATAAYEERLHALRASVAADPERREGVVELARLLHDGHRTRDAVAYYSKAIELDPAEAQAYYDLASAHGELGEWDLAAGVLLDRLDQDAGDAVARYDLGAVRANQGRTVEAMRLFEEARETTTDGALLARISDALARLKGS